MEIGVVSSMIDLEKRMEGGVPPLVVMDRVPQRREEKRDKGHFPSENNGSTTRERYFTTEIAEHTEKEGEGDPPRQGNLLWRASPPKRRRAGWNRKFTGHGSMGQILCQELFIQY